MYKRQDEHRDIFGNGSHQISKSKINGRVRVNLIENATKSIYYEEVAAKMQEDIQSCLDNGFKFSDITILCRGNFDIFSFSQLLGNLKVNYHGEEVYIKTISESGLTLNLSATLLALTEFLRWEQNPKNLQFPVKMLYYLKVVGRINAVSYTHLDVYKRQVQFTIGSKFFARTRFSTEFQFGNQCRTFSNGSGG